MRPLTEQHRNNLRVPGVPMRGVGLFMKCKSLELFLILWTQTIASISPRAVR